MGLTKSVSELGSIIPTPDAAFWNITDTICDKIVTNVALAIRTRNSDCILYCHYRHGKPILIWDSKSQKHHQQYMIILRLITAEKFFLYKNQLFLNYNTLLNITCITRSKLLNKLKSLKLTSSSTKMSSIS